MALLLTNWSPQSASMNCGKDTGNGSIATAVGGPGLFSFQSPTDNVAAISAANYFVPVARDLSVGDFIFVNGTDGSTILRVLTVVTTTNPATVTTLALTLP